MNTPTVHINVRRMADGSIEVIVTLGEYQETYVIPVDKVGHIKVPLYCE